MNETESFSVLGPEFPPAWLRYRDAFAVLQHISTLCAGEASIPAPWQKVVVELGFGDAQGEQLLAYLVAVGCLEYQQGRRQIALTEKALSYLEWERGRRRSLRPALSPE